MSHVRLNYEPRCTMLSKANLAIVAALGFAAATIYLVHHSQSTDRKVSESSKAKTYASSTSSPHAPNISRTHQHTQTQRMRMGVERDIERQRRKEENVRVLEEQIALHHRLEERDRTKH